MRIVTISDTHGCHRELNLPKGDILIHAGDVCNRGNKDEVHDFLAWFSSLDFQHKIFISGNHDWDLENDKSLIPVSLPDNITYLDNSNCIIEGIRIFGVPYIEKHEGYPWSQIPKNTDILITHNPPYEIHDKTPNGLHKGSESLLKKVLEIKPKVHLFGHIHLSYGTSDIDGITYINPSNYDASLDKICRLPIVYDYD